MPVEGGLFFLGPTPEGAIGVLELDAARLDLALRAALIAWYRDHAAAKIGERVDVWYRRLGVPLPRTVIRDQQKRWASCDGHGTLRFNWRIGQAPVRLVDYVVVHELAHLRHRDHDKKFWALLGRVMPDYEQRRARLREIGPGLGW